MADERPSDADLYDAYVYLLGRALVVRQEVADLSEDGIEYNLIKYNPVGSANFVNPNLDVAYLEAWIAVDEGTLAKLSVPKVEGRYYTAQLLDEWGEVIANINEREFPHTPYGDFALHAPGAARQAGEGIPVELHSKKAKLLARVEIGSDPEGALVLQRAFVLASSGSPQIDPPPPLPAFTNADLLGAELFEQSQQLLASAPEPTTSLQPMKSRVESIAGYVATGEAARLDVDSRIKDHVVAKVQQESATGVNPFENGWLLVNTAGRYGDHYHARTAANLLGIWANVPEEAKAPQSGLSDSGGRI